MEEYEMNPFANMLLQHQNTELKEETLNYNIPHTTNEIYNEDSVINFQNSQEENLLIKQEPVTNFDLNNEGNSEVKTNDSVVLDDIQIYQNLKNKNDETYNEISIVPKENQLPKKKGRPKGTPNKRNIPKSKPSMKKSPAASSDRLPRMNPNVHKKGLSAEDSEELKKLDSFFQLGVCFKIAPELDQCKECFKRTEIKRPKRHRRQEVKGEVDCRFYQFRKLRYNGDKIEVFGFLHPETDPIEVDKNVWLVNSEKSKKSKNLSAQNARLILTHVGDELCNLIENEKIYLQKYKSEEKEIIWKRLIVGVVEICDLCSTTLFNFHFICTKCGLSLCVDCVTEYGERDFEISCSNKSRDTHSFNDLSLTQIIVGDCMEKLQKQLHDSCKLWNVKHDCTCKSYESTSIEQATKNLVKNLIYEMETGKSVIGRELPHQNCTIDVDFKKIEIEKPEPIEDINEAFDDYFNKTKTNTNRQKYCKPIKHYTSLKKENVISISRSMCQTFSNILYPDVPHKWLCENKLLRLLEPLHPGNESFFHGQWQRGQPVIISNILDHLQKDLWIPQAFSTEFGHERSDFINCMNGNLVLNREISSFWDGFENVEKRLKDNEGKAMLLKLKDWPPDSDFKNIMPSRFNDIMKNLPLNAYTNRTGDLNIVKYLPNCFLHPDLGPKGYFAYGSPFFLKEGTTNLHLDVSDAVNVMCYVGFPRDKNITIDEYVEQGFKAILEADCDISNINRVIKDGEIPGAIWHIYEACDADRIRDFLLNIAQERGFKVEENHDVIHDQNWYLDGMLRARLYKEYGVRGYAIVQCLGDCIILPAGTPHQVRNIYSCIKIAEDFVSPQQVAHCLHLSNEFRKLTKTHTNNEEKLNIKNVAYHSCKEALAALANLANKKNSYYK
ncbi:CLUMA_CG006571, isoform A [Clunio marinus]|uniref:CLUMA_CG006571, isoform A n=1 Tax=Clunio marinus TaxID=568069 RepID=A0A1J1HYB0_9DIPT|nr:CLUMA_CG006571, isoform A [Clunio marinus]